MRAQRMDRRYSRKLNSAQKNYTTIEKELLSIVETLKTFWTMLLGAKIKVSTDHKNLTHKLAAFTTQRVLRWRLLLEEFDVTHACKEGRLNFIADAISRIPTSRTVREEQSDDDMFATISSDGVVTPQMEQLLADQHAECLLVHPEFDDPDGRYPTDFETIQHYQQQST